MAKIKLSNTKPVSKKHTKGMKHDKGKSVTIKKTVKKR